MPTYEYACSSCTHEWEAEQSIKDDPLKDCPRCNNATAKRQISRGTGFILKGSGWYADLYSGGSNARPDKGSDGASKSEGSSSGESAASTPTAGSSSSSESSASSSTSTAAPSTSTSSSSTSTAS
ncbi:FmdB family transcriptional regulator [Chondromyces crocatus]|uniref:FmdB family transcriptional regulator n=1 Tax=Chondromyces crocatus TaxID=52 RepID=A0A0K1EMZ9_CHOCO|nr:FmdB family transcriptional regulator [Chondromyces crocatus]